ncbi:hypothetical protein LCGC14_2328740 [marine sediment metagenome]|uniref:Uncharacterized protein n=1 Tax=marine sediment metagenome TaxID=412755 RepID=A0A0F9CFH1_9ZZZZ
MDTHYTDMSRKPCPLDGRTCIRGYCADCDYWPEIQRGRARELAKEIENLKEVEQCREK